MTKTTLLSILVVALTIGVVAEAQQPAKIRRIGYLTGTSLVISSARTDALREGLRELGYFEGEDFIIEYRSAEGKLDRFPALAAELVRLKVDIIVSARSWTNPCCQGRDKYYSHRDDQ